jgi:hypothetical protein
VRPHSPPRLKRTVLCRTHQHKPHAAESQHVTAPPEIASCYSAGVGFPCFRFSPRTPRQAMLLTHAPNQCEVIKALAMHVKWVQYTRQAGCGVTLCDKATVHSVPVNHVLKTCHPAAATPQRTGHEHPSQGIATLGVTAVAAAAGVVVWHASLVDRSCKACASAAYPCGCIHTWWGTQHI